MKNSLTKASGILSIIFGVIGILGGLALLIIGIISFTLPFSELKYPLTCVISGPIIFVLSIVGIMLGVKLTKAVNAGKQCQNLLAVVLIFSFCCGSIVTSIVAVTALCLSEDVVAEKDNAKII